MTSIKVSFKNGQGVSSSKSLDTSRTKFRLITNHDQSAVPVLQNSGMSAPLVKGSLASVPASKFSITAVGTAAQMAFYSTLKTTTTGDFSITVKKQQGSGIASSLWFGQMDTPTTAPFLDQFSQGLLLSYDATDAIILSNRLTKNTSRATAAIPAKGAYEQLIRVSRVAGTLLASYSNDEGINWPIIEIYPSSTFSGGFAVATNAVGVVYEIVESVGFDTP